MCVLSLSIINKSINTKQDTYLFLCCFLSLSLSLCFSLSLSLSLSPSIYIFVSTNVKFNSYFVCQFQIIMLVGVKTVPSNVS